MHDFDEVIDRRGSNSMKWAQGDRWLTPEQRAANPLPMWVADMDFRVAQPIRDALTREIEHGVFGYGGTPDHYLESVCMWQQSRFGWDVEPAWVTQTPGVVSALNMCIQAFSHAGDHVLIQPPVYFHFQHDVVSNGRRVTTAPLTLQGGRYVFDPEVFEAAIVPGTRLFVLCNPHNPTGNVWSESDLRSMAEICLRHDVLIVADEVHQDLVFGAGARYIPLASLGKDIAERTITCTAPSKTFNTAGLACSNVFISNARLRQQFRAQCDRAGISLVNTMGTAACDAAYRLGAPWAAAMLAYVQSNQEHFASQINAANLPVKVLPMQSLYLAWMDFRSTGMPAPELHDTLIRKAGLWLDYGPKFGHEGEGFMRINLACARSVVDDAITRLQQTFGH